MRVLGQARDPDKLAVVIADTGHTLTYGELDERSARLARVLWDAGLRPGDVVTLLSQHCTAAFEVFWAARRSGLSVTPIDTSLSLEETAFIINDSGARALFVSGEFSETATSLRALTPYVSVRFTFDEGAYKEALAQVTERLPDQAGGVELRYSAGTTGRPRAAKIPFSNVEADVSPGRVEGVLSRVAPPGRDTILFSPTPLADLIASRVFAAVHGSGGTVVTLAQFAAEAALRAISEYGATMLHFVPSALMHVVKLTRPVRDEYDVSTVSALLLSSAPCSPALKKLLIGWLGPVVHELYGGVVCEVMSAITARESVSKPGSVGRSVVGPIHVCDVEGVELPVGEVGLVYVDNETLAAAQRTAPIWSGVTSHPGQASWITLGDLGHIDEDGYLYLADRQAFAINVAGAVVYPRQVEDVLVLHPQVRDVAVIGIPDGRTGQQVKAVVHLDAGARPGPAMERELLTFLRGRVPAHAVPRSVDFADVLPRTATGKLIKRRLEPRFAMSESAVV